MDKRLVLAVAGSGKTRLIIDQLDEEKRSLIVTYTNNNADNIRQRVLRKFGYYPSNISIYTYHSFLYRFCYLPIAFVDVKVRSVNLKPIERNWAKKTSLNYKYYVDSQNRLWSARLALLLREHYLDEVKERISRYFDHFIIDEVQDFAAHDFNFINDLAEMNMDILYVGDYYQHTFDTGRDGNTNANLFKQGYDSYKAKFASELICDEASLDTSFRCGQAVCDFIEQRLDISIQSNNDETVQIELVSEEDQIHAIMQDNSVVKLFYKMHYRYDCRSNNWGASKGIDDYHDVCVVLNPGTYKKYMNSALAELSPETLAKLYVAITRARGNVFFVNEKDVAGYRIG